MANTYLSAPAAYGGSGATPLPAVNFGFTAGQRIAVTTTSAQSAVIDAQLIAVRSVDTDFWITIAANPTASVAGTSFPVTSGELLFFPITPGFKVALITASGTGNVSVMPCI